MEFLFPDCVDSEKMVCGFPPSRKTCLHGVLHGPCSSSSSLVVRPKHFPRRRDRKTRPIYTLVPWFRFDGSTLHVDKKNGSPYKPPPSGTTLEILRPFPGLLKHDASPMAHSTDRISPAIGRISPAEMQSCPPLVAFLLFTSKNAPFVAMPGARSSVRSLLVRPGAPSSVWQISRGRCQVTIQT